MKVDGNGNVHVAGSTTGILRGQSSSGGGDAFVRKYDPQGNEVWTRQFGSSHQEYATGVAVDAAGSIYVAGQTSGTLSGQTGAGGSDAFLSKYDPLGNALWTRQFGASHSDYADDVAVDAAGNIYVAGLAEGALPSQDSSGNGLLFVRKYDLLGEEVWTRLPGPLAAHRSEAVATDRDGNVYVVGSGFVTKLSGKP